MNSSAPNGTLFLVAGPSGAGKDTLILQAAAALKDNMEFHFPQRTITRPAEAGGEPHIGVDEDEFRSLEKQGCFALTWRAHGLCYGIPAVISSYLAQGHNVIVNVSRSVIRKARLRYGHVHVLYVMASEEALRERLTQRRREAPADIEERIARARAYPLPEPPLTVIDNSGDLDDVAALFLSAIKHPA